ncbi:hypothetical protein LAZ67_9003466, partial [Cordylochernes scorpioides]
MVMKLKQMLQLFGDKLLYFYAMSAAEEEEHNVEVTEEAEKKEQKKLRKRKRKLYKNLREQVNVVRGCVCVQMEFYFSDANLSKDRFLSQIIKDKKDGYFGTVEYVSIPRYKKNNKIKGFAFVEFDNPESAKKALDYFIEVKPKESSTQNDESMEEADDILVVQAMIIMETKLNEKYNLKYKNYNILRKDRNKEGGGLAFLIKNLYYEDIAINIQNTSDLEAQGIKVYLSQNKTINIFNMYHPPNNKLIDDGTMAQFLTDNTIIVGDLNAKHQLWGCSMPNPRGKILSNIFDDNAFMCLNDGNPTHHSYSYNTAQALDISFSSPDIFHKCKWQILKSIGSDHLPILIEISTKTKTSSIKEKFWNFKKANWNLYQKNTNEDFRKAPTRIKDLEQNWISFKNTIIKAAKVSIPRGNIKKWIPNYTHQAKDIQTLITKRNELQKKCTQNQTNCRTELNIVNAKIKSTHNIFHEKINMKELDYALENTDLNKTPGPDGIHGQMISNLDKNGKEILLDIFNNSWKTGKLPQDWKTATIIPIKKLDKSADDPKNYRPISLTSICCKLMEKIILRRLTYHLDTRNLLPEEQYGFRKGHGTIDQLLFFTQK